MNWSRVGWRMNNPRQPPVQTAPGSLTQVHANSKKAGAKLALTLLGEHRCLRLSTRVDGSL